MSESEGNPVQPIPIRMDLPEEIAAVAISDDETDEPPTVILNTKERSAPVWADLRSGGAIIGVLGLLVGVAIRWLRDHTATLVTVGATSVVTATATVGVVALENNSRSPTRHTQPTVTVVTPRAGQSRTASPQPAATVTRNVPAGRTRPPDVILRPTTSRPTATSTLTSTGQPTRTRDIPRPTLTAASPPPGPTKQPPAANESEPRPTTTRPATSAPTTAPSTGPAASTARDCVVRVDVDPLLDLCVLG